MKALCFTLLAICLISYNSFTSINHHKGITNPKDSTITAADTATNWLINTNNRSNSVHITSDNRNTKSSAANQEKRNTIEISGEQNSVNITENDSNGLIQIKQNGNNNQINISKSNGKSQQ
jgi:hypothetical protein